jgi:hypothetical protein
MTVQSARVNGKPSLKCIALEKVTIKISKVNDGGQLPHHFLDSPLPVLSMSGKGNLKKGRPYMIEGRRKKDVMAG